MNDTSCRKFAYRSPRLATNLALDFIVKDTITIGVCESISEGGLSASFSDELEAGLVGRLTLYHEMKSISVQAAVAGREGKRNTMQFILAGSDDQNVVRVFIEFLRANPSL
jgi:hypothetical protein